MTTAQEIIATVSTGDVTSVNTLLERAPFLIHARDGAGRTPLAVAAWCGHTAVAELLLAHGADVNARDRYGWTPLREADCGDRAAVADLLRQHGGMI
ncbi:MAG: ankyrin repeat domain-containing protein [Candidatus Latescibacteria bacterium]|nr:ankyrin repeat domain-containing protein [Candidatus Latescibacterota bacterium]